MQSITTTEKQKEKSSGKRNTKVQDSLSLKTPVIQKADPREIIYRIRSKPESLTREEMIVLQNTIGNKAVIQLLAQAKKKNEAKEAQMVHNIIEQKTAQANKITSNNTATQNTHNDLKGKTAEEVKVKASVAIEENDIKRNNKSQGEEANETPEKAKEASSVDNESLAGEKKKTAENKPSVNEEEENNKFQLDESEEAPIKKENNESSESESKATKQKEDKETKETGVKLQEDNNEAPLKSSKMNKETEAIEKEKAPSKEQAVQIKGENPEQILEQLGNVPPAQIYNAFNQAQAASAGVLQKQMIKAQEIIPSIQTPTGINPGNPVSKGEKNVKPINHKSPESFKSQKSGGKVYDGILQDFKGGTSSSEANPDVIMSEARKYTANTPTISMTGEADPTQIKGLKAEAAQSLQSAQKAELNQINSDFGENRILPKPDKSIIAAPKIAKAVDAPSVQMEQMQNITPEVAAHMDPSLVSMLKPQIDGKRNEYQKGKEKFDSDMISAKAGTETNIEQMKTEAAQKQKNQQVEAKTQVNTLRVEWKNEINGAVAEYNKEAETATQEKGREVNNVKNEKENEVKTTMADAEKEANKEYNAAKTKADEKNKEKEKSSGGIIGWIKKKAKQIVDSIKKAISSIFDGLRKAVKFIFDKAKKAALGIIEAGRKLIAGIIKSMGQVLKGLVKTVFAKFPKIANKICSKIDQVVNKAVEVVNTVAATLKKGVSSALDFLAKTVNKLITGVQSLYNGVISSIGKFLKGDFKTIFLKILEAAQIAAEIALAFATGGGSVLLQILKWVVTTLPGLYNKVSSVVDFIFKIKSVKFDDIKQSLKPSKMSDTMVKGLFGELQGLPVVENDDDKEKEPEGGKEGKGLAKVLHIVLGIFNTLKGVYNKVAGGINKILPKINISTKTWFNPLTMIYAGVIKAMEVVKNPAEALNEGAEKIKEAISGFFGSIKEKLAGVVNTIKEKVMQIGNPAQLLKILANKAVDMVLNFIITHPPSALIKTVFKAIESATGGSLIELIRRHIPFADKLINKIIESKPVQGLLKPLEQPAQKVVGVIDDISERAVGVVDESEQKATGMFGNGAKLLKELAVISGNKKDGNSKEDQAGEEKQAKGDGDFLSNIKAGIHIRLVNIGQKLLQSGKALVKGAVDKVKGFILGVKVKFNIGTENHELWLEKQGSKNVVMMASTVEEISKKIKDLKAQLQNTKDENIKRILLAKIDNLEKEIAALEAPNPQIEGNESQISTKLKCIGSGMQEVSTALGVTTANATGNNGKIEFIGKATAANVSTDTIKKIISFGVGFIPIVGDIKDIQEVLTGVDIITGEKITWMDRGITFVCALLPIASGKAVREVLDKGSALAKGAVKKSDELVKITKAYANYALAATKNAKARKVVLGKFMQDNVSYVDVAIKNKATYFQLDNWNEVSKTIGDQNMWNINKEFLNQQWSAGKDFYFSHDPWKATGYFEQEVLHLIDLGAKDFVKVGDMWKLVK